MAGERNYARFYALLKQLPHADKDTLVWQYTQGPRYGAGGEQQQ